MPSMYFRTTIPEHLLALILFIEEKLHHENNSMQQSPAQS